MLLDTIVDHRLIYSPTIPMNPAIRITNMLLLSYLSLIAVIVSAVLACTGIFAKPVSRKKIPCDPSRDKQFLGQKGLSEMLAKLADSTAPANLKMGAKCYAPRMTDFDKSEIFICPKCKKKTAFTKDEYQNIEALLTMFRAIQKKMDVDLDLRNYCSHCNKKKTITASYLIVRFHDTCEEIVTPIDEKKLQLLQALVEEKDRIKSWNDQETALKDFQKELKDIFFEE